MALCRHCNEEIVKVEGQRMRRFYCSHTCYERYNTRKKYYKDLDKSRQKAKERNAKPETKLRYRETIKDHKRWCKEMGLTITQYTEYGYTFLKENPEVVETLRLINEINSVKQTTEERKEYQKKYYQKNREVYLERSRVRRLEKKNN